MPSPIKYNRDAMAQKAQRAAHREANAARRLVRKPSVSRLWLIEIAAASLLGAICGALLAASGVAS
jgi:L-cysteine desulfidase